MQPELRKATHTELKSAGISLAPGVSILTLNRSSAQRFDDFVKKCNATQPTGQTNETPCPERM